MSRMARGLRRAIGALSVLVLLGLGALAIANRDHLTEMLSHVQHVRSEEHGDDSCGHDAHDDHGHGGHGHSDEPTVATTLWADRTEIFLERPYAVAGEPMEMLVHVSVIHNGAPVTEGSLAVEAEDAEGQTVRASVAQPVRPGIFLPEVMLPKSGTYQTRLVVTTPQLPGGSETIELPPVEVYPTADEALAAFEHVEEEEASDEISYLKEQQWRVGLTTTPVQERDLVERLVVPGYVIAPPGAGAVVSSPIAGRVLPPPDGRLAQIGESVKAGQVLAVIEPAIAGSDAVQLVANHAQLRSLDADLVIKQLDLETQIQNAELAVSRASEVLERKSQLVEQGISPGKDKLLAKHELDVAEARLTGLVELRRPYADAREQLASVLSGMHAKGDVGEQPGDLRVTLRSPIAGNVVEVATTSGELASGSQKLFRILNLDTLWIEANVSEYDLSKVQQAPGASYRLAAYPDRIVPIFDGGGRLIDIGAEVDPDTRTVPIRYEVANQDRQLRVGMFADLLIETQVSQKALAVPSEAILEEAGETVVYVQLSGEAFQRQHVRLGVRDAQFVEIRKGLSAGDRVATKGAYSVRLATLSKQTIGHGHTH